MEAIPLYRHPCSPKKYAQPQLLACLVLKEFFRTDYRGIVAILADMPELQKALVLKEVPHYTTLQKASRELLKRKHVHRRMERILGMATEDKVMRRSVSVADEVKLGGSTHLYGASIIGSCFPSDRSRLRPHRLIDQQDGMGTGRDGLGDLREV